MKKTRFFFVWAAVLLLALVVYPNPGISSDSTEKAVVAQNKFIEQGGPGAGLPTNQIIIRYKETVRTSGMVAPANDNQMQRLSDQAGIQLNYFREMSGEAHVLQLPERLPVDQVWEIARKLMLLPEVEYAEPDAIMLPTLTPNDPQYGQQWHYFSPSAGNYGINAPGAWDLTTGSASIVVAVIDTGITNHADLSGRTVPGYDFITTISMANDGNGRDSDPSDPGDWVTANECYSGSPASNSSWHGTHTAGTIGAASNNSLGVAGINWQSKILPVRVLGKCGGTLSDIADGMRWSAGLTVSGVPNNANPAKVLNLSLGGSGACGTTYQDAINAITAAGSSVVVSAGNSNADAVNFRPANCSGVITVAATDRDGNRAYYSNYGSVVEISAPGGETNVSSANGVLSTLNTGTQGPVADTYTFYQGTSMSAPHVAGVASLLYSHTPSLTPTEIRLILQSTVTTFPAGSTCNTSNCGTGILNARNAVASLTTSPGAFNKTSPGNGVSNQPNSLTLSWEMSSGATSYEYCYDTTNDNDCSSWQVVTGASANISGLSLNTTYYWQVKAKNASGFTYANGGTYWNFGTSGTIPVYLPLLLKSGSTPTAGPTPGFWESTTGDEFYVTTDSANVDNFAIYVSVTGCGNYKITHSPLEPISGNQFSFTGSFYASGTFTSNTAANGKDGLSSFNIPGCGVVSGGPWTWNATWQNSTQPTSIVFNEAKIMPIELVTPVQHPTSFYKVTKIK